MSARQTREQTSGQTTDAETPKKKYGRAQSRSSANNKKQKQKSNGSRNKHSHFSPLKKRVLPPSSRDSRVACRKDNLSKNISHFTAPSHFGQQASIGMFLVPLTEFTNSGGDGGEQTDKPPKTRRALFRAARADKEEIKNVNTRSLNAIPCVVTQGSRRRSRAVVFPLPPLVVTVRLHRKCCIVLLPPTAPERSAPPRSSMHAEVTHSAGNQTTS